MNELKRTPKLEVDLSIPSSDKAYTEKLLELFPFTGDPKDLKTGTTVIEEEEDDKKTNRKKLLSNFLNKFDILSQGLPRAIAADVANRKMTNLMKESPVLQSFPDKINY
jgi:hypothetical protein